MAADADRRCGNAFANAERIARYFLTIWHPAILRAADVCVGKEELLEMYEAEMRAEYDI